MNEDNQATAGLGMANSLFASTAGIQGQFKVICHFTPLSRLLGQCHVDDRALLFLSITSFVL